ncbi:MAG: nitroreductase family deazaflavin-dependent oxidoreductase [Acidimicrobiia bacterium]|nr:nitroreductase family deazaflavin-dependent oxidoreductase [Acidimicrobiia bacterium]
MSDTRPVDQAVTEEQLRRIEAGEEHPPKPDFISDDEWRMIIESRDPSIIRMAGTGHVDAYRATGGEGMDETQGAPVLILTTTGRKSGHAFSTCLNYMTDGDDLIVVGSFAGFGSGPNWSLNLEATPRGQVEVRDRSWPVVARMVTGEERARLWPRMTEYFPLWGHFQKYCRREFAVFVLSEDPDSAGDAEAR